MAGDEQRHQLVAQLLSGHLRAILVAGLEQHREHVVPVARVVAALVDQLRTAARSYGLIAHGFQMDTEALATVAKPLIIFWAFQHFMVLEGIRKRFGKTVVLVNDPSSGPREIEWDEFDSGFTGIVLTFEPGPDFSPGGRPPGVLGALLGRRLPTGRALPLILLASLLLIPVGLFSIMIGVVLLLITTAVYILGRNRLRTRAQG